MLRAAGAEVTALDRSEARLKRLRQNFERMNLQAEVVAVPAEDWQDDRAFDAVLLDAPCTATDARLLVGGRATFDALLEAICGARHHVHVEYYIFEPDETGTRLLQALIAKARAGVKVRLLVDAIGSPKLLSRRHRRLLDEFRAAGGEFAVFHPARLDRLRPLVNLRTHRKIVVIDGHTGRARSDMSRDTPLPVRLVRPRD